MDNVTLIDLLFIFSIFICAFSILSIPYTYINCPILRGCCPLEHKDGIETNYAKLKVCAAMNSATHNIEASWLPDTETIHQEPEENRSVDFDSFNNITKDHRYSFWNTYQR